CYQDFIDHPDTKLFIGTVIEDVDADVVQLLRCLQRAVQGGQPLPWNPVLPLYPTSPVGPV
ncbi:MAG: hypothetical protein CL861_06325, partial [Cyanobium sp. MED843]|nr:hypothetical protein [Cyanobium sp. MED843]